MLNVGIGPDFGKKIIGWTRIGGDSVLMTKPISINTDEIKYKPLLNDTVELEGKPDAKTKAIANDILLQLKKEYGIERVEKYAPEIVENVENGIVETCAELSYLEYKTLEEFCNKNPELFVFMGKEKGNADTLQTLAIKYGPNFVSRIAKDVTKKEAEEIYSVVDNHCKRPNITRYMDMLILKKYNPETYEYIATKLNYDVPFYPFSMNVMDGPSIRMLEIITPQQMRAMKNDTLPPMRNIGAYVDNSDVFAKKPNAVQELSTDLSKHKISNDVVVYRGDKTVGMFDSVAIDDDLQKRLRQLLEQNKDSAQEMKITTYNGRYNCGPSTNLYDFLSSKETLTLADAMQLVKFGDEKLVNEIITQIKNSKIIDTRFKSLSFDKGMAFSWSGIHAGDNTTIVQNVTVKKGTEGGYHDSNNDQFEIILNNTPKEMSFQKVTYNRETDTFEFDTTIQNINV